MKKYILIFTLLTYSIGYSQSNISENLKVERLIQVWGLLKYKHPNVSRGSNNMDIEFFKELEQIQKINSQYELNAELLKWIKSFESKKYKFKVSSNKSSKLFTKNADYSWIDNANFSQELISILNRIKDNNNYGDYYASINKMSHSVQFKNDNELIGFNPTNKKHRLLFLASFWNKMRYWNVNIYLTQIKWNTVLTNMIPEFSSSNPNTYKLAKDKLFASLNDSHSNYNSSYLYKEPGRKFSLYSGRIINDTLVVKTIFNSSLAKLEGIELGDMIYSINDENLASYYKKKFGQRISVSNENYLKSMIERYYLLSGFKDSLKIGVLKKNNEKRVIYTSLQKFDKNNYKPILLNDPYKNVKWKSLNEKIGYINLSVINKSELKKAFKAFQKTKGIVIDLRNYPRNIKSTDLPYFLYTKKKVFMKILATHSPSIGEYDAQSVLKLINNPFAAGRKNRNFYKGLIVLLVDRSTASKAEYYAMAIQASPNCITIGEQTFGAIMNRNQVILKDKTSIDFTLHGAFYPDNTNAQRKGLKIDHVVPEKAKGYTTEQYVNEAIRIIINNKVNK